MDTSILRNTKKILGIDPDDDTFDLDIIVLINSALSTIQTLGLGQNVYVEDEYAAWEDFVADEQQLNLIKTIVYLRVKMMFDPPASSYTQQAMQHQIDELEWRLNVLREDAEWVDPHEEVA